MGKSFVDYFRNPHNLERLDDLMTEIELTKTAPAEGADELKGKTFVVTGSLIHFKDRSALKERIEAKGGKVSGSVSAKTECLINNDINSTSGKNKTAKELNIPILSEEDFLAQYGINPDF
jgi:DNA ligase (NAD+)